MTDTKTEAACVASARTGDRSSFEELVRRHEAMVFRVALSITRNEADAEDAVQESFIKAYRYLDKFRGDSLFSTWLTRIAVNEALMNVRRRRPNHVELDETSLPPGGVVPIQVGQWNDNPEKSFAQTELRKILFEAIRKLAPAYQIVFALREVKQLSNGRTAQLLGLKVATVKSRMRRARLMLRSNLAFRVRKGARNGAFSRSARPFPSTVHQVPGSGCEVDRFALTLGA
jgi:RNA polymerase sigma-70 factor, ECF subfamily